MIKNALNNQNLTRDTLCMVTGPSLTFIHQGIKIMLIEISFMLGGSCHRLF